MPIRSSFPCVFLEFFGSLVVDPIPPEHLLLFLSCSNSLEDISSGNSKNVTSLVQLGESLLMF